VCPASIVQIRGNTDPDRIPDFCCAFYRSALGARARFPARPDPLRVFAGPPGIEDEMKRWRQLANAARRSATNHGTR
jgi:hypothetical protein